MKPQRIQLQRRKGWNLQRASLALNGLPAVNCARPGRWGNPFKIGSTYGPNTIPDACTAVACFRVNLLRGTLPFTEDDVRRELRGKNLACFCRLDQVCHCDVLLEEANR